MVKLTICQNFASADISYESAKFKNTTQGKNATKMANMTKMAVLTMFFAEGKFHMNQLSRRTQGK